MTLGTLGTLELYQERTETPLNAVVLNSQNKAKNVKKLGQSTINKSFNIFVQPSQKEKTVTGKVIFFNNQEINISLNESLESFHQEFGTSFIKWIEKKNAAVSYGSEWINVTPEANSMPEEDDEFFNNEDIVFEMSYDPSPKAKFALPDIEIIKEKVPEIIFSDDFAQEEIIYKPTPKTTFSL